MVAEAFLMRGAMAMALLLLLGLCSVSLSAASALPSDGLNQKSLDFTSGRLRHRSLLQAPVIPPAATPATPRPSPSQPPVSPSQPPVSPGPAPPVSPGPAPGPGPARAPGPAPRAPPAPPTPTRVYLMWIGIGAFLLVLTSVAVFCLCRKFGENKIRRGQRLPPLPRYH